MLESAFRKNSPGTVPGFNLGKAVEKCVIELKLILSKLNNTSIYGTLTRTVSLWDGKIKIYYCKLYLYNL